MGLDFSALIHYRGPTPVVLDSIAFLEAGGSWPELQRVVDHGRQLEFAFADYAEESVSWRDFSDWETPLPARPSLPSLQAYLDLPSGFSLTFGTDAVWVYHLLRWHFFVSETSWQPVMLGAVRRFCEHFEALDCIIAPDEHPAVQGLRNGSLFQAAVREAEERGEGEVPALSDLYLDKGYADDLCYVGPGGEELAVPIWDTHGYWRYDFRRDGAVLSREKPAGSS